ncbi:DNA replication licensing factor mcm8 [Datura stramonium]|uniref:DNA replication licensing factor mcm8 n=1 Tax=Datura stramonium TaxID=4076 RepID=A0ABS8WQ38_DATST|nr:DNA replication licensing factor mcm8 [Datura stramonium]
MGNEEHKLGKEKESHKTVNENLKMSGALLSRFDLVFILLDKPDEVLDQGSLVARLRLDPKKAAGFVPLPAPSAMTKPAADILQKFYLKLRDHNTSGDGTPITARQLESLNHYNDKYVDEHGFVDFGRSGGMSQQKEAKRKYVWADRIALRVPDIDTFVDNLNSKVIDKEGSQDILCYLHLIHKHQGQRG